MNHTRRASLIAFTVAAASLTLPAFAQTHPAPARTYLVTTQSQSPAGTAVVRESLGFRPEGDRFRLFLASADGTTFSSPVSFTPEGAIATNSQDGAITCYNMAMSVVASDREPARYADAVFVLFGGSVVRIPLEVRSVKASGKSRSIALTGQSAGVIGSASSAASIDAGIVINATVDELSGQLHDATFDEVHFVGTQSQVVGHSACAVTTAGSHPAAVGQT